MLADGHLLYVGGYFGHVNGLYWQAGSIPAERIAVWDTQAERWRALPNGGVQTRETSARVSTIARYGNAIYLGGGFTDASHMASRHFAAFIPAPRSRLRQRLRNRPTLNDRAATAFVRMANAVAGIA